MRLSLLCLLCLVHLALVRCGLFNHHEPKASGSRAPAVPRGAGSSNHSRVRPLFARRGQYERQRIHVQKPKAAPVPPNYSPPPAKQDPSPAKPTCSQLTQTCTPLSGCCDPSTTCHCRFFNAICYCRRGKSQREKKTQNASTPNLGRK